MDYHAASHHMPHRKPLPEQQGGANSRLHSSTQTTPNHSALEAADRRTRTSFSSLSAQMAQRSVVPLQAQASHPTLQDQYSPTTRRTMSNSTESTSTDCGGILPVRTNSSASSTIRRPTSSRSRTSSTNYVALIRRQKGTVWCERAQYQDPRLAAQQRAAKHRAAMEVVGGNQGARASTSGSSSISGGVRSRIRHHGAQKASTYSPATLSGAGVPVRLSSNEVGEGDSDDGDGSLAGRQYHDKRDCGRSSLRSARKVQYINGQDAPYSRDITPTNGRHPSSLHMSQLDLEDETPVPSDFSGKRRDYFDQRRGGKRCPANGSSEERESSFGRVRQMLQRWPRKEDDERKDSGDVRRRDSVDDRTMTMGGGRLFVANPDLSD